MPPETNVATAKKRPEWNYKPDLPIKASPVFEWPPSPARIGRWFAQRWMPLTENAVLVVIGLVCWTWLQPSMETMKTLSWDWVLAIWLRNFILIFMVAGALHWYFHREKKQGKKLKYDPREGMPPSKLFTFGTQVHDNMFWTLGSGVFFWTAYEVLMFWAMANGYAPFLLWSDNSPLGPIWFIALYLLTPVWISFHFYWIHRALHWPPLYRLAHALHHRNTNVGPWSGISMHPLEHAMFFSSVLIHFIVPAHPLHILFHMQHQALTGVTSHTGFEGLLVKDENRFALGTFHHQMHHRYFEVNYGNLDVPWDKWFGSFHDGTEEAHERMKERRKAMLMK